MSVLGLSMEYRINGEEAPEGFARLAVAFERAGAELAEVGKYVFPLLVPVLEAAERQQFDSEGGGQTGSWAPLSEQYAAWKEKNFPGRKILDRTGTLREALTNGTSVFARREMSADNFVFGTSGVPYATFHQLGTVRMPARPEVDFSGGVEADIEAAARAGVRAAIRAADPVFAQEAP